MRVLRVAGRVVRRLILVCWPLGLVAAADYVYWHRRGGAFNHPLKGARG